MLLLLQARKANFYFTELAERGRIWQLGRSAAVRYGLLDREFGIRTQGLVVVVVVVVVVVAAAAAAVVVVVAVIIVVVVVVIIVVRIIVIIVIIIIMYGGNVHS